MPNGTKWTQADEAYLRKRYSQKTEIISVYDIADELARSVDSITCKAHELGIYKFNSSYYLFALKMGESKELEQNEF